MCIKRLEQITYEIVNEEKLPKLSDLKFRSPLSGFAKRLGTCFKVGKNNFKIVIYTTKARWFKDNNGTHIDRKTKCRIRRASVGEKIPEDNLQHTLAHEIAHMKYWRHDKNHKQYTEKIFKMIKTKLGEA